MSKREALDTVSLIIHEMEQEAKRLATVDPDIPMTSEEQESLLSLLEQIRVIKGLASDTCRVIEGLVTEAWQGNKDAMVGPYSVQFRWGKQRKWSDNDGLVSAVTRQAMWNQETGEVNPTEVVIHNLRSAFRLSGDNVRTTWLRDHDIDPDNYGDGPYKCSIQIVRTDGN